MKQRWKNGWNNVKKTVTFTGSGWQAWVLGLADQAGGAYCGSGGATLKKLPERSLFEGFSLGFGTAYQIREIWVLGAPGGGARKSDTYGQQKTLKKR